MSATQDLKSASTGKSLSPVNQFQTFLNQHRKQIEVALPAHMNADRMCRLALTAFQQNPMLKECEPRSVFASVVIASQMGLEIGVAGQGYLVPYKKNGKPLCQFIPGWQGLVDLVNRAGKATVWTGAVYEGDEFFFELGDSPRVKHIPEGEDDPAKLRFTYAVGRVKGSDLPVIEVWPIKKLKAHFAKNNKVGDKHYAHQNWEMYCRKIPLLQVLKYMPKSIELMNAVELDAANDAAKNVTIDGQFINITDDDVPPQTEERKDPGPERKESDGKKQEPPAEPKKVLKVVDTDGVELFETEGTAVVGQPGAFKGRPYKVKEVADGRMIVEWVEGAEPRREPAPGPVPGEKKDDAAGSMLVKFVKRLNACRDVELLDIVKDETRMHTWTGPQQASIDEAYNARLAALKGGAK